MKKYNIQLLIKPQMTFSYWKGIESNKTPKKINDGVIQIGKEFYNSTNIKELIITENHQPN